jgi:O-antigen ligase
MKVLVDQSWLASAVRNIGVRLLGFVVVASIIPFGSVMTLPFLLVSALCLTLALLAAVLFEEPETTANLYRISILIMLVSAGWVLLQAQGLFPASWQNPAWEAARAHIPGLVGSLTLTPGDAVISALAIVFPMSVFITGLILCDTDERARFLLAVLGTFGGLAAIFGLVQFLTTPDMLLAIDKKSYLDSLTGLFVNRNTAATFFGLAFLVNLARLRDHLVRLVWRAKAVGLAEQLTLVAVIVFTLSALMALMLTRSRAGIAATGLAALIYVPYLVADWKKLSARSSDHRLKPLAWGAGAFVLTLAGFVFFAAQAILRLKATGIAEDGRFCIFPNLLEASRESGLTGSGFGAFRFAFAPFRDPACGIGGIFDRAHNGYIEAFMGLGILFPVLLVLALVSLLLTLRSGWRNRRRSRHYSVLGLAGLILVLVHAGFDFSLQIPGFAAYFAAFTASIACLCMARIRRQPAVSPPPGSDLAPEMMDV